MKTPAPEKSRNMLEPAFFSSAVASARRFYLDLNPSPRRKLSVLCGGLERCAPDYAIRRDTFPYLAVEYVAGGSGRLMLAGESVALEAGTVFSYGPGVAQDIASEAQFPLVKYFVNFSGKSASALLQSCQLPPGRVTRVFPANALIALFDEVVESGLSGGRRSGELCGKLLDCLALKITQSSAPINGGETLSYVTYQRCRRHIEQNFLSVSTLQQIARECRTDVAYLCRLFRRYDQQSPYQRLLRLKMNHAAERLQHHGLLVKQAAKEVGFEDPFHFSRVFRKTFGVPPAEFRNVR